MMVASHARQKLGQLTSSTGAGVIGVGLGALAATSLRDLEAIVLAVGLALHIWGMVATHRAEDGAAQPAWVTATYWLCWAALVGLAAVLIVRAIS